MKKTKSNPVHYVDNKKLTEQVSEYSKSVRIAKQNGNPLPKMNDYIGDSILKIATRVNNSPNFTLYPFKSEMIGDGILNCIKYLHNFNPEKSSNAFAYITQICWYSSMYRIKQEKKQKQTKIEMIKNSGILEAMQFEKADEDTNEYHSNFISYLLEHDEEKKKDEKSPFPKRTTKAYQQKMKDLEEKERKFLENINGSNDIDDDIQSQTELVEEDYE